MAQNPEQHEIPEIEETTPAPMDEDSQTEEKEFVEAATEVDEDTQLAPIASENEEPVEVDEVAEASYIPMDSDDSEPDDEDDDHAGIRLAIVRGNIEIGRDDDEWERVSLGRNTYIRLVNLPNGTLTEDQREDIANQLLRGGGPQREEAPLADGFVENESKIEVDEKDDEVKFQFSMEINDSGVPTNVANIMKDFEMGEYDLGYPGVRYTLSDTFFPREEKQKFRTSSRVYCCEYSADGEMVSFAEQNRMVHILDTNSWKEIRHVELTDFGWSIVDTSFSPDKRFVAFSGWSGNVTLVNLDDTYGAELTQQFPLGPQYGHFCQFSIEFDPTSRLLMSCGSGGRLIVYNFETQQQTLNDGGAHIQDINAGCWVDSQYIMASGSDDATIKVWDTRQDSPCVGGFVGHFQGLTCVTSRGDGRYVLSNAKDQSMKLWDLRQMNTPAEVDQAQQQLRSHTSHFDYRGEIYRRGDRRITTDKSVVTYTGHVVQYTLIRAAFSPMFTTASKYVFCGSADGNVYIYNTLTGELLETLAGHPNSIVRDLAWHPFEPVICSAGFDEYVVRWGHASGADDPFIEKTVDEVRLEESTFRRGWW